jgi:hypothetical protein
MAVIALPNALKISEFALGVINYELEEASAGVGSTRARIIAPPRWTAHVVSNADMDLAEASRWETLMLQLRGSNVLALYDIVRQAPRGTLRGSPTLTTSLAVGEEAATFGSAAGTLLQGDWIQIGTGFGTSQLVKLTANATAAAGSITISFANPIRKAISSGSALIWDKPVGYYRRTNRQATLGNYTVNIAAQGGFSMDLTERFA